MAKLREKAEKLDSLLSLLKQGKVEQVISQIREEERKEQEGKVPTLTLAEAEALFAGIEGVTVSEYMGNRVVSYEGGIKTAFDKRGKGSYGLSVGKTTDTHTEAVQLLDRFKQMHDWHLKMASISGESLKRIEEYVNSHVS